MEEDLTHERAGSPVAKILIVALVAIGIIGATACGVAVAAVVGLNMLGNSLESKFQKISSELDDGTGK